MTCTKEEIERKLLAARQKKQAKLALHNATTTINPPLHSATLNPFKSPKASSFKTNDHTYHPYPKPETSKSQNQNQQHNLPITKAVTGTTYLISESRFELNPSEFCTPLINICKTIPSKSYDSKTKLWNFSIDDYQDLMNKVAPLAPDVVLEPLPPYVLKVLKDKIMDPSCIDLSPIEPTLREKLMSFQEEGVRFGIARRGRCMIADDMGLGKTFQALGIASYYRHNWPMLIVTTSSMRETWQTKMHELLPSVPMMNIVTLTNKKDAELVDSQTEVVIVSYKTLTIHRDLLTSKNFGVVIVDESHHLKSHKAQCTAALARAAGAAARVLLLSGTPALSRPAELYTQLALIEPALFRSYTRYGKRYCAGRLTNFGWDMSGQSHLTELQVILQKRFLIRRTKEQVLPILEEKTRESVLLDDTLFDHSKEDMEGLTQMAEAYRSTSSTEKHSALVTYFSQSARIKTPAICKYIRQVVQQCSDKFLVFAHHRCVLQAACAELDRAHTRYIRIDGSTPANIRADLVDKFQQSAECRCGVLSVTAAGVGLTLTAADLVIFAELHWNPGVLTQAEARAHRLGRRGAVRVRYLLARGTADDVMWPMLQHKLHVLNDVGLSKDSFENATMKHQESNNKITQYLSPQRCPKNKNDYIPGTNIRKHADKHDNMSQEQYGQSYKSTDSQMACDYKSTDSQMTSGYKSTDSQMTSDYKSTDSQMTSDYKSTDSQMTSGYKSTDSQMTSDYKSTDSQMISDYKSTDSQMTSGYKSTDSQMTSVYKSTNSQIQHDELESLDIFFLDDESGDEMLSNLEIPNLP